MNSPVITVTLNPAIDKTIIISEFKVGGLNRVVETRSDPGGKGINVARVLSNFETDVTATGFIAGFQGQQMIDPLKEKDITLEFIKVNGETRTNLKIFDEQTKLTTEVNECGFKVCNEHYKALEEKLNSLLDDASLLVLSGSIPEGVSSSAYKDFIRLANKKGVPTILDADGIGLKEGIKAKPYAIKPNINELEELVGRSLNSDQDIVNASRELINQGISLVLVSLGAQGAICLDQDTAYRTIPFRIIPGSTVGAGDSMVGALSYALLNQKSLQEIAVWTTTAGTVTASKPGTQVCTFQEVKESIGKVHLSTI